MNIITSVIVALRPFLSNPVAQGIALSVGTVIVIASLVVVAVVSKKTDRDFGKSALGRTIHSVGAVAALGTAFAFGSLAAALS